MNRARHSPQASASYRHGMLTIDLPNAAEPVLWRQEIRDVSRISFTLQHLPGGDQALVLRTDGGAEQIIATFGDSIAASDALAALRAVLLKPVTAFDKASGIFWRIIKWMIILLVIIFGIRFAFHVYYDMKLSEAAKQAIIAQETAPPVEAEPPAAIDLPPGGVPLVADEVLQPPMDAE